jgi:uncharacterized protein
LRDDDEGLSASGLIVTGARRERVTATFEPIIAAAADRVRALGRGSLYVYGSVSTGAARRGSSDVDLLTVDVPRSEAEAIGLELSATFAGVSRAVEVAVAESNDYVADGDAAYGNRVFLRHYCVHLEGPDGRVCLPDYPGDVRAARGFNGDIARHAQRWREAVDGGAYDPAALGRRIARKTLLAIAGLVSVHDKCWTTDRDTAAQRWSQLEPCGVDAITLLRWSDGDVAPTFVGIRRALDGIVATTTESFATSIGLWT